MKWIYFLCHRAVAVQCSEDYSEVFPRVWTWKVPRKIFKYLKGIFTARWRKKIRQTRTALFVDAATYCFHFNCRWKWTGIYTVVFLPPVSIGCSSELRNAAKFGQRSRRKKTKRQIAQQIKKKYPRLETTAKFEQTSVHESRNPGCCSHFGWNNYNT